MNTIASSVINDANEEKVTSISLTIATRYKSDDRVRGSCRDNTIDAKCPEENGTGGSVSPDIVPDDEQVNCVARDDRADDKLHDYCQTTDNVAESLGRKRSNGENSSDSAECHECKVASLDERLKQIADEQQSSDKMELDLPDVVPERAEATTQKLETSEENEDEDKQFVNQSDEKLPLVNENGKVGEMPLRSVLKKLNSNKKHLRVSFCDTPTLHTEPVPLPNLMMFWDSDFGNCWNECVVIDDESSLPENGLAVSALDQESEVETRTKASGCRSYEEEEDVILRSPSLTTNNVYHHDKLTAVDVCVDSDSETNSSQDTVILMTSEESKRNRELIQQSQRRFQQQKPSGSKDDFESLGTSSVLRSNSAVRKCLERTALRRSLTQCSDIRRKTHENNSKQTRQVSVMEKLRQLTNDADCTEEEEEDVDDDDDDDNDNGDQNSDAARSLPRLDLRQVRDLMSERCPLHHVYSEDHGEDINVPRDVRQWKLRSKLWEQNDNRCLEDESEFESNYSSDENVELAQETTGDELEQFVQQDWERIERVRQRYHLDGNDALLEFYSRRPSVRGIRPRFGSTTQIINQLHQQMQPPPLLAYTAHRSWPNSHHLSEDHELAYARHSPRQQSVPSPSVNVNNNRLSFPITNEHVSRRRMNANRFISEQNTRFVSDV